MTSLIFRYCIQIYFHAALTLVYIHFRMFCKKYIRINQFSNIRWILNELSRVHMFPYRSAFEALMHANDMVTFIGCVTKKYGAQCDCRFIVHSILLRVIVLFILLFCGIKNSNRVESHRKHKRTCTTNHLHDLGCEGILVAFYYRKVSQFKTQWKELRLN